MDLKIFFDSVDELVYDLIKDPNSIFNQLRIHTDKFPEWKSADIALIGLSEDRGNIYTSGIERGADAIRSKLYKLKKGNKSTHIVDLGNLRNGIKIDDTYLRLKEVCEILLEYNIVPVIIGTTHDLDYGQFMAYEKFDKLITVANIDAILDLETNVLHGHNKNHTHQILMHEPNYLFNFSNIGYQSFANDYENVEVLEKLNFENYRIGHVRKNLEDMEPVIRQADMVTIDITAIRISDAPGNPNATPFGLSGEEACQLTWYAGMSNKLSSLGIYEYYPDEDVKGQTAGLIATMIWYFFEGFYNRKSDTNFRGDGFIKYSVTMKDNPIKITFYKHKISEMWWMEVPYPLGKEKFQRVSIMPCSYSDYEIATKGELPIRWINTHAKLI